jgi:hypothetical protein
VLTFLVLATTSGGPLGPDATARLSAVPMDVLTHEPETRTVWLAEQQHLGFAGWQTRSDVVGGSHWHVGDHGVTAVSGAPWPRSGRFGGDTSWASQLTARLTGTEPAEAVRHLAGTFGLVRLEADGRGWITADVTGAGPVYVAEHAGLLAVSNRAELARDAVTGATSHPRDPRSVAALPWLGSVVGRASTLVDVTPLQAAATVTIDPASGARVCVGTPVWHVPAAPGDLVSRVATEVKDSVAALADLPAPRRVIDLTRPRDGRLILAAAAAAEVVDRFELVARGEDGDAHVRAARTLAGVVGRDLVVVPPVAADDLATVDRTLREQVGATGAIVPADLAGGPPIREEALLVSSVAAASLRPHAAGDAGTTIEDRLDVDPGAILTVEARRELDAWLRAHAEHHRAAGIADADMADLVHLGERLPREGAAESMLCAPATVIDPLRTAAVASLALTEAKRRRRDELQELVVAALTPGLLAVAVDVAPPAPPWRGVYPLLEGELLGRPGGPLDAVLERDVVRAVLRGGEPAPEVQRALWAATTAAVWLSHGEAPSIVARRVPDVRVAPRRPEAAPVIITGITSRSFIDLARLKVPLERTERDPLLAVRVDREVAELTDRLLVTVDASLGDIPADLDERMGSAETARFADAAVQLLARRGNVLADPRLGLTLPFWRAHVATPQVVLVAERPTDLLGRLERPLPAERVLTAWLDVVTATLTTTDGVRCVDPDDIADGPIGPEGDASAVHPGADREAFDELLSVTSVIDSLIRELEVEAVRPIVREIRRARLAARRATPRRVDGARFPLAALDALTELRQRVGELESEVAAIGADRDAVRDRLGEVTARRSVRWAVGAARLLGRPPLPPR